METLAINNNTTAQEIADALGMKVHEVDAGVGCLYMGDNYNYGLQYRGGGILGLQLNGNGSYDYLDTPKNYNTLLYKKSKNGCVCSIPYAGNFKANFGWCKAVDLNTGEEGYCYFKSDVDNSVDHVFLVGVNHTIREGISFKPSSNLISMSPVVLPATNIFLKNLYNAAYFENTIETKEFLMNNKEYVAMQTYNTSFISKLIFEL